MLVESLATECAAILPISNFAVSKYNGRTVHIKNTNQNMNYNNKNEYG